MTTKECILEIKDLKKHFKVADGLLHAVDGVSFTINKGETLGIVGESGCGKSTLGRLVMRLTEPTSGQILYKRKDITAASKKEMMSIRKEIQIIFQDPYSSLNPRMTVRELIMEPIRVNSRDSGSERARKAAQLMDTVGLTSRLEGAYPHELDGGRRQRIGIARALALDPRVLICDEPVSALDVSIQAQILNLLMDLQQELDLTYLFITHDLSVVRHISTNIAVMYLGKCVELSPAKELFKNPCHPYTKALLSAIPLPRPEMRHRPVEVIRGEVTSPVNPKPGCRFLSRCPVSQPECSQFSMALTAVAERHLSACLHGQNGR